MVSVQMGALVWGGGSCRDSSINQEVHFIIDGERGCPPFPNPSVISAVNTKWGEAGHSKLEAHPLQFVSALVTGDDTPHPKLDSFETFRGV